MTSPYKELLERKEKQNNNQEMTTASSSASASDSDHHSEESSHHPEDELAEPERGLLDNLNGMIAAIRLVAPRPLNPLGFMTIHRRQQEHYYGYLTLLGYLVEDFPLQTPSLDHDNNESRPLVPEKLQARYLREACSTPSFDVLRTLLEKGKIDADVVGRDGRTTLCWMMQRLANHVSRMDRWEYEGTMDSMVLTGIACCIKTLVEFGASVEHPLSANLKEGSSTGSLSPLLLSPMDYIRGLVDRNAPERLCGQWGARRLEMVSFLRGAELLVVDYTKDDISFCGKRVVALSACEWVGKVPPLGRTVHGDLVFVD